MPVTGPGVRITIKEVAGQVRVEPFIDMVQALRSAGAEAIQINGEVRVVASTLVPATSTAGSSSTARSSARRSSST